MATVNNISEKYCIAHSKGEKVDWHMLEAHSKRELKFRYIAVKDLVIALWDSYLWRSVCLEYAKIHRCSEFEYIIRS